MGHGRSYDACEDIRKAIVGLVPDALVEVKGARGHYDLQVTSTVFAGKNMLESHRIVYGAIAHLMNGDDAPVHAVDSLRTRVPQ